MYQYKPILLPSNSTLTLNILIVYKLYKSIFYHHNKNITTLEVVIMNPFYLFLILSLNLVLGFFIKENGSDIMFLLFMSNLLSARLFSDEKKKQTLLSKDYYNYIFIHIIYSVICVTILSVYFNYWIKIGLFIMLFFIVTNYLKYIKNK